MLALISLRSEMMIRRQPTCMEMHLATVSLLRWMLRWFLQHASGLLDLYARGVPADASGDGSISAFDAALILQFITGFINCLPADANCSAGKGF